MTYASCLSPPHRAASSARPEFIATTTTTKSHQADPHVHQQHESFDLIKAGATQTKTSLIKQHAAGERVDFLDDYDFPARTITETTKIKTSKGKHFLIRGGRAPDRESQRRIAQNTIEQVGRAPDIGGAAYHNTSAKHHFSFTPGQRCTTGA